MKTAISIILLYLLCSCSSKERVQVTDPNDYDAYLNSPPVKTTSKYFELWNSKIKSDSLQLMSFGNVASEYTRFFKETGDILYLKKAEKSLLKATEIAAVGKSGYYRALARNYISQHRFKEALQWAEKAYTLGSGLQASQGLLFDIHMELGHYDTAKTYLDRIRNHAEFDYLIRAAKWNDYKGNLEVAIRHLEKAREKSESANNRNLRLWTYTNLADFYGHAGRIEESYQHFLKALEIDSHNAYAKKGIAWIVFSHEKNAKEALRILDAVTEVNKAPDYHILRAEIASYLNEGEMKNAALDSFYNEIQDLAYGPMYDSHAIAFYLEHTNEYKKAIRLAEQEVMNRATPETYDLLAYAYFKNGNLSKAYDLVSTFVEGKTYEPKALFHLAEIYKAKGLQNEVQRLKEELDNADFEMGPSFSYQLSTL